MTKKRPKSSSSRTAFVATAILAGLGILVPPLLASFGPDSVRSFLQRVQRGEIFSGEIFGGGSASELRFETLHRKLGDIERKRVRVEFPFENTSSKLVKLARSWASCGCLRVNLSPLPILPGASGKIEVDLDATDFLPGSRWELVKIYTDEAPEQPYVLMIEANVR